MLTHRAPLFLLKAWPYRPGRTWANLSVYQLQYQHTPCPCHLTGEDGLSRMMDELHLIGCRVRADTLLIIPVGSQVSTLCDPLGSSVPLPWYHNPWTTVPIAPQGKGDTLIFSSQHFVSSASSQRCQMIHVTGRDALWMEVSILKLVRCA